MANISTVPTRIVPAREALVRFAVTGTNANYVRVWCTVAPQGSELAAQLESESRVLVYEGGGGPALPWRHAFDRGGAYTLVAQEYTKGAASYGGGYEGSPDSAPSETKVGYEETLVLHVGQRMTAEIGAAPDVATLVLWVWDDSVRETTVAAHGEDSPTILNESPTAKARAAMASSSVTAALNALIDQSSVVGDLATLVPLLINNLRGHAGLGTPLHVQSDTVNYLSAQLAADAGQHLDELITSAITAFQSHVNNEANPTTGGAVGPGSANYHAFVDRKNAPIVQGARGAAQAYVAFAELWRAYEAHRTSDAHGATDSFYRMPTAPRLLQLHIAFLGVLASTSLSAPPGQSTLATELIQLAGFEEA